MADQHSEEVRELIEEELAAIEEDLTGALTVTAERTTAPLAQDCVAELDAVGREQIARSRKQVDAELQAALANPTPNSASPDGSVRMLSNDPAEASAEARISGTFSVT